MMQNIDTYNYGFLQILDSHVVEIPYDVSVLCDYLNFLS